MRVDVVLEMIIVADREQTRRQRTAGKDGSMCSPGNDDS